jgi:hypothetical protein
MDEFHDMFAMYMKQRVDLVRIARMGVGNHHMHEAMRRHRVFPGERLVDPRRRAVVFQRQILRAPHEAQMRAIQRTIRGSCNAASGAP